MPGVAVQPCGHVQVQRRGQRQAEFGIGGAGLAGQAAAFGRQAQRQLAVFKQFVRAGGPGFVAQVEASGQLRRAATQRAQLPVQPPPAQPLVGAATVAGGGEQAVAQGRVQRREAGQKAVRHRVEQA